MHFFYWFHEGLTEHIVIELYTESNFAKKLSSGKKIIVALGSDQ
jgi:hypothetical protein